MYTRSEYAPEQPTREEVEGEEEEEEEGAEEEEEPEEEVFEEEEEVSRAVEAHFMDTH